MGFGGRDSALIATRNYSSSSIAASSSSLAPGGSESYG